MNYSYRADCFSYGPHSQTTPPQRRRADCCPRGCGGPESVSTSSPEHERPENVARNPEHVFVRHAEETPVLWHPSEDEAATATADRRPHRGYRGLVATASTADALRYADVDGADEAAAFVDETAFVDEMLLVETAYGQYYRDASVTVTATADRTPQTSMDVAAVLVRPN